MEDDDCTDETGGFPDTGEYVNPPYLAWDVKRAKKKKVKGGNEEGHPEYLMDDEGNEWW